MQVLKNPSRRRRLTKRLRENSVVSNRVKKLIENQIEINTRFPLRKDYLSYIIAFLTITEHNHEVVNSHYFKFLDKFMKSSVGYRIMGTQDVSYILESYDSLGDDIEKEFEELYLKEYLQSNGWIDFKLARRATSDEEGNLQTFENINSLTDLLQFVKKRLIVYKDQTIYKTLKILTEQNIQHYMSDVVANIKHYHSMIVDSKRMKTHIMREKFSPSYHIEKLATLEAEDCIDEATSLIKSFQEQIKRDNTYELQQRLSVGIIQLSEGIDKVQSFVNFFNLPDNEVSKYENYSLADKRNLAAHWFGDRASTNVDVTSRKSFLDNLESRTSLLYELIETFRKTRKLKREQLDWGKTVYKFKDDYFIELIPRAYSEKEGKAMGHCGNSPRSETGDVIFSLRRKLKNNNYSVHATITFHQLGAVIECKGYGNSTPTEEYQDLLADFYLNYPPVRCATACLGWLSDVDFSINKYNWEPYKQTHKNFNKLIKEKPYLSNLTGLLDFEMKNKYFYEVSELYEFYDKVADYIRQDFWPAKHCGTDSDFYDLHGYYYSNIDLNEIDLKLLYKQYKKSPKFVKFLKTKDFTMTKWTEEDEHMDKFQSAVKSADMSMQENEASSSLYKLFKRVVDSKFDYKKLENGHTAISIDWVDYFSNEGHSELEMMDSIVCERPESQWNTICDYLDGIEWKNEIDDRWEPDINWNTHNEESLNDFYSILADKIHEEFYEEFHNNFEKITKKGK